MANQPATSEDGTMTETPTPDSAGAVLPDTLIQRDESIKYWNNVESDVNGMLGGIPSVSRVDLLGSRNFLAKLGIGSKSGLRVVDSALEGGAGIGRITEGLLLSIAKEVDVIEPVSKFTAAMQAKGSVRHIFNVGLEDWLPTEDDQYDLIWVQWCAGHLTDEQLVLFLKRCKEVLNPNDGIIVIKENLSTSNVDVFDEVDSSVTRQDTKFRALFDQAALRIVKTEMQKGFPKNLLPVRVYALKP